MFDANMKGVPLDHYFFAEVWSAGKYLLRKYNLRRGDIIKCCLVDNDDTNAGVFLPNYQEATIYEDDIAGSVFIYAGELDGTGFIDSKSCSRAKQILGGEFLCQ